MKRIRLFLVLMATVLSSLSSMAHDFVVDGIYYDILSDTTAAVTYRDDSAISYSDEYAGNVIIPETVTYNGTTYSVTKIKAGSFLYCDGLTSVTIPYSVTEIPGTTFTGCTSLTEVIIEDGIQTLKLGYTTHSSSDYRGLFFDCPVENLYLGRNLSYYAGKYTGYSPFHGIDKLKSVTIGKSVTAIGENSFSGCNSLTSVEIPNSVTSIGNSAFSGCSSLTSVAIGNSVTEIGGEAFYCCTGLTSVAIPNSVTAIGYSAFSHCSGLTSVTIGNSVTEIGVYAFYRCSGLTEITIPYSVTSIGGLAFCDCSLKIVDIADCDSVIEIASDCFSENSIEHLYMGRNISGTPFNGFSTLKETTIGNSVTTIGESSFSGCGGLTSVAIPNSVTAIGNSAFSGCSGLTSVAIGNSVTEIGSSAFSSCGGLTSVAIPNSVTAIGSSAFSGCSGLTSVAIGNSVTEIGSSAFSGCGGLTSVAIPNSVTAIGSSAFSGCGGIKELRIKDSAESLSLSGSYLNSSNVIETLYLGRNITGITFSEKTTLKEVTIGDSVTTIGSSAFAGCSGLTEVTIPNSVTTIGESAFEGCNLKTVDISDCDSVIEISSDCFSENPIEHLYMGRNISGTPFNGFTSLKETTIGNHVTTIGSSAFAGCSGLASLTIPNSVTTIGNDAFDHCSRLTELIITDGTETLSLGYNKGLYDDYALFDYCPLEKLYLGRNLSYSISPFCNIPELKTVTAGNSVSSIGDNAFNGCYNLASITLPNSVTSIGNSAFQNCNRLTEVTIPNSVTTIRNNAFLGCSSLTSVTIGSSVSIIGTNVFGSCNNLIEGGVKCLGVKPPVLTENWALEQVEVPVDALCNYAAADYWSNIRIIYAKDGDKTMVPVLVENNNSPCVMVNNTSSTGVSSSVNSIASVTKSDSASGYVMVRHCNNDITDKVDDGYTFTTSIYHKENAITTYSIDASNDYVIHVYPSGNLINQIDVSTIDNIHRLKITGDLNGTDILTIRKMTNLKILDMSEANIVNGGMSYYNEYTTSKNEIGAYFFKDKSNLEMVYLPKTATKVSGYAFGGCTRLSFVSIPDAMTYIAGNAFDKCTALASVRFEDGFNTFDFGSGNDCLLLFKDCPVENLYLGRDISFTGSSPFKNKGTLSSVTIGDLVPEIKPATFYGCTGLTTATIGNSVTTIGNSAFYDCKKLSTLTLGNSVMAINDYAFYNCRALPELTIHDNVKTIGKYAFFHCDNIASLSLGILLQAIGDYAFSECESIEDVVIPNSLTDLGNYTFHQCDNLISVIIGNSVTNIGNNVFYQCGNLQTAVIGDAVITVGPQSFSQCGKLESVIIGDAVTTINNYAFSGCVSLTSVKFGNSVKTIGVNAFYQCGSLNTISLGNSVTTIGDEAFMQCDNLETVSFGNSVSWIGENAFANCAKLNNVNIPPSVNTVGNSAFANCSSLKNLRIENGDIVLNFGTSSTSANCFANSPIEDLYVGRNISYHDAYSPFKNKTSMINLTIGDNTASIKNTDYEGCTGLEYLVLGKAVNAIADYSFSGCTHLQNIYSLNTVPAKIYENTFNLVDKVNCMLYVPEGCRNIYWLHPYWEDFYNIVETNFVASTFEVEGISYSVISAEAQAISTYSVSDDLDVKVIAGESKYSGTVSIPDMVNHFSNAYTVTHIDAYAFSGCVDLASVTLPASLETVGNGAFGGCSGLKEITAMGTIPADASETAFDGVDKNTCVLYVPFGCREVYANAPVWEEFYNIVEKAGIGGVEDIAADGAESVGVADGRLVVNALSPTPVVVYTMSGSVVFNGYVDGERHIELPRGFYIVRLGAESKKISL